MRCISLCFSESGIFLIYGLCFETSAWLWCFWFKPYVWLAWKRFYSVNRHSWAAAYDLRVSRAGHISPERCRCWPSSCPRSSKSHAGEWPLKADSKTLETAGGGQSDSVISFKNLNVPCEYRGAGEIVKTGMELIYGGCRYTASMCTHSVSMKTTPSVDSELQLNCSPRSSLTHSDIKVSFTTPINSFAGL